MFSTISCCKDCKERHLGCHSKCERYIKQKEDLLVQKEYMKKSKNPIIYGFDYNCYPGKRNNKIHTSDRIDI